MWYICFGLSVAVMTVAALVCALLYKHRQKKQERFPVLPALAAGFFITGLALYLPVVYEGECTFVGIWQTALLTALKAMELFGGGDFKDVMEAMPQCPEKLQAAYRVWGVTLHAAAPICTAGVILSAFRNISAGIKYGSIYFKNVYIFSGLSDASVTLARDLKKYDKKAAVVFTAVADGPLLEEAKALDGVCFRTGPLQAKLKHHCPGKNMTFFAIDPDEGGNVRTALGWIEAFRGRKNTDLYVFAAGTESELLLNGTDKGHIKLRRIDNVRRVIDRYLFENGCALFDNAKPGEDGIRQIGAVVVGLGRYGAELVKALSWYTQMDGYRAQIYAFDKDELAQQRLEAQAPELLSDAFNNNRNPGEAQYGIDVHTGVDVETAGFDRMVKELKDTTAVFIALGSDQLNLRAAIHMRMLFEQMGIHPQIFAVAENGKKSSALENICNFRGQPYDITFIGDRASSYSLDVILNTQVEREALQRHLKWGSEEEFWKYEYNYCSSVASALHRYAKLHCGVAGADKKAEELTEQERLALEAAEHRRWNAYMRAQGYMYSGSTDPKTRNDLGKMHHDLVSFELLPEQEKRKDSAQATV